MVDTPANTGTKDVALSRILPQDVLLSIRERAPRYDEENTFFDDDLGDLKKTGYLTMSVPREFGGAGLGVAEISQIQRTLAQYSPATALGLNMHQIIVALCARLHITGDTSTDWVLRAAMDGAIFGFGISEAGNDSVLFDSTTTAVPTGDGGYRLTGTKIFTSLSPVWTHLVVHARIEGTDELVFGFIDRDATGIQIKDDWDTLGMRATQSCTTVLTDVLLPADRVSAITPAEPNANPFVFGIFGCFELFLASVYNGIGERSVELACDIVKRRMSKAKNAPYATDPDIRWQIATAAITMDGASLQLEKLTSDFDAAATSGSPDYGMKWFLHFSAAKNRSTEAAKVAVDTALRVCGGAQYYRASELQRLYRDVLAGIYQPSDNESLHAAYSKALLGALPE